MARKEPPPTWSVPACLSTIHTPLCARVWACRLHINPDREFTAFLIRGFSQSFQIGLDYGGASSKPAKNNMVSAKEHPEVVAKYLQVHTCTPVYPPLV